MKEFYGTDINKLFDTVVKTNNYDYIFYFTLLVSKAKLKQIGDILVRDAFYLTLFNELISNHTFINY